MLRLISRQWGGLAALKLIKLFGINDFPAAKDSGKVLIIIIYCYLIIVIIIIIGVVVVIIIIIKSSEVLYQTRETVSYLISKDRARELKTRSAMEYL